MNLIIDVGNTNVKLAVFKGHELMYKKRIPLDNILQEIDDLINEIKGVDKAIISSVGRLKAGDIEKISRQFDLLVLDASTKVPFQNNYKTPATLGVDRIALVSAAVSRYEYRNVLIIDAGTCITYDFINSEKKYMGGSISPGVRLRYQSLNNLTANLPLLETKMPDNFIGDTTAESIHSGVIQGILNEIDGNVIEYENNFKDLTVILTGGDSNFLSKQLKSSIFAHSNFLLEGLNYILEFNSNE